MADYNHRLVFDRPDPVHSLHNGRGHWPGRAGRTDRSELLLQNSCAPSAAISAAADLLPTQRTPAAIKTIPRGISGRQAPAYAPWHFLYFLPLPQGQRSLRPILLIWRGFAVRVCTRAPWRLAAPWRREGERGTSASSNLACPLALAMASALVRRGRCDALRLGGSGCLTVMVMSFLV